MKVLIVKTSSLGDIIQSFGVLDYLHNKFPGVEVDWVVESSLQSIVSAHPLVHKAIPVDTKSIRKKWSGIVAAIKTLREQQYDLCALPKSSQSWVRFQDCSRVAESICY
jgi:heptosyltransferase-1